MTPEELREIRQDVAAIADLVGALQVRLMKQELREFRARGAEWRRAKYGVADSQAPWKEWYG